MNLSDGMNRTALHLAAWKGDPELVQLLLLSKASTSQKAKDNFSPLHFATQSGSLECCKLLVEKNPKLIHESISKGKKKALHLAAAKNNFDVCEFLLKMGADPSALTSSKQTALDFASDERVFELIKSSIAAKIEEAAVASKGKRKSLDEDATRGLSFGSGDEDGGGAGAGASAVATAPAATISSPNKPLQGVNAPQQEEKGGGDKKAVVAGVVRKAKKQKVSSNIMKLSCYDDVDVETEDA